MRFILLVFGLLTFTIIKIIFLGENYFLSSLEYSLNIFVENQIKKPKGWMEKDFKD